MILFFCYHLESSMMAAFGAVNGGLNAEKASSHILATKYSSYLMHCFSVKIEFDTINLLNLVNLFIVS